MNENQITFTGPAIRSLHRCSLLPRLLPLLYSLDRERRPFFVHKYRNQVKL